MSNLKTYSELIGEHMREYRNQLGETQETFAKRFGISRPALSLLEQGKQEPDLKLLVDVIKLTKVDITKLLNLTHRNHLVLDTNVILNCPYLLNSLTTYCDAVYVPQTVIEELNYQKDHGSEQARKNAGLCLNKLIELQSDRFIIPNYTVSGRTNDDKIFELVKSLAENNVSDMVYLLTNDKDFKLKNSGKLTNLKVINTEEFDSVFKQDINYNVPRSQRFFDLVSKKKLQEVKEFDMKDVDVNFVDTGSGFTPLIQAIRDRNLPMIDYLLTLPNLNVNSVDNKKYGFPPISHAVQLHSVPIIEQLLTNGANVNEPSRNERNPFNTPLMIAAWGGDLNVVKLLIESGACLNQQDKGNGFTPLIKATFQGHDEIVKYLLDRGADKNVYSFERKKALDYAYEKNHQKIISLLKD